MNAPIHKELPAHLLNAEIALRDVTQTWDSQILKELTQYIEVPAKSPSFDANWEANGYLDTVLRQTAQWIEAQKVAGLSLEIVRLPGRTPVLFFEVEATRAQSESSGQTVLMYGHLDKQPEMTGWDADLGPWTPVIKGDKLYGRGGADDGYALFGSLTAIAALKALGADGGTIRAAYALQLGVLAGMADRVNVMYAGAVIESGTTDDLFAKPRHPYTVGLLRSIPRLDGETGGKLVPIEGRPPDLVEAPVGCSFYARCAWRTDRCATETPALAPIDGGKGPIVTSGPAATHVVACFNPVAPAEVAEGRPLSRAKGATQ